MRYLLDTNILSDLIHNPQGRVGDRIREVGEALISTSIIVAAELRFGAAKNGSARLGAQVDAVLGPSMCWLSTCPAMLLTAPGRGLEVLPDQSEHPGVHSRSSTRCRATCLVWRAGARLTRATRAAPGVDFW